jgi:hypothetical protein
MKSCKLTNKIMERYESQSLCKKLESSATLEEMLDKLKVVFGDRVSIDTGAIRLDNDHTFDMAYHQEGNDGQGFFLSIAGELMLGIAELEGADSVNVKRIRKEIIDMYDLGGSV